MSKDQLEEIVRICHESKVPQGEIHAFALEAGDSRL